MRKSKEMCSGCRNDIYNNKYSNPSGTASCSHYRGAKVKKRLVVHSNQKPPYNKSDCSQMLSCYTPRSGLVAIDCGCPGSTWED